MQVDPDPAELPDDPRLVLAVKEFCAELEAGRRPDRQEFLLRFPDLAEPLAQCLAGLELVHKAAVAEKSPSIGPAPISVGAHDVLPANPLGDFQIMREIGRGGMGIVYEAVQLSLGRRVALKVLPFASTFDNKHLQRFHNEAHAAAQLHHTNIVPVYAVGHERGVHFYAMQLIEGHSLAVLIRQIRRQVGRDPVQEESRAGAPAKNDADKDQSTLAYTKILPLPNERVAPETVSQVAAALSTQRTSKHEKFFATAARFVMQAAEALEHAHQCGIVHRDIKPGNLLVDVNGRLWITDFGLAHFHADANLTRTGDLLGTLRYMSPEQAAGRRVLLDHRADIYSLGATLYELVTLEPMFSEQDHQALLYQIIHDEPRAPRSLDKSLPVDLETIILKAVSKNPAERYATAQDLAADLQQYLDDKPIRAKRPSLPERVRKWRRRHPSFVAAAVVLLVLLTASSLATAYVIRGEQEKAENRADEAEARFELARRAVNEMIDTSEEELADNPFAERPRKRLLEAALNYYQEFIELRKNDPKAQEELIATQDRVKRILADLALLQGAGELDWLKQASVVEDLRLDDEQRKQVTDLSGRLDKERGESFRKFRDKSQAEKRQAFLELARANDEQARKILGSDRMKRLSQIARQLQGLAAFRDPDVVSALKLTSDQRERIRTIEAESFRGPPPPDERRPPDDKRPGGPREDFRKMQEQKLKESLEKVLKLLTQDQLKAWNELKGEPFTGTISFPPPFGRPGRGP
jgi:eukaryotic-like serine/threonine-protein kinase